MNNLTKILDLIQETQATIRVENAAAIKRDIDKIVDQLRKIKIHLHVIESKANYSEQNIQDLLDESQVATNLLVHIINDDLIQEAVQGLSQSELYKLKKAVE